jgi:hypothetical protein
MELESYILCIQRSSPEFVIRNTADISRLLYSELHNDWIWEFLRSQAVQISPSILVMSFPSEHHLLDKIRAHFITELKNFSHVCEAILHLKVLVALITRNSIRFTIENFNELYIILEQLVEHTNKRLIELTFYTLMILLSLNDDYSSMLSLHSILSKIALNLEGKRLLYALESRDGKWGIILQEMNEFFGFDIKMPEGFVEKSSKIIIGCRHGEKLDVEDMDDKCLAAYIVKGGKQVSIESLVHSLKYSTDAHFMNLAESVMEKLQLRIPEHHLLEILVTKPELSYRVLFYSLIFNDKVRTQTYSFDFMFEIDIRKSLKDAKRLMLEKLLHLINDHLPWFFISSLSDSRDSSQIPDSFIFSFVHSLPNPTAEALMEWKSLLAYQPLKVALSTLDILEPLRTMAPQDLFNPLRVFSCISLENVKNIE